MVFEKLDISGAYLIEIERIEDERGFFARTWCPDEFACHGIDFRVVQCSLSFNAVKGTLRGMHFQRPPHEEGKLIRCTRGAIFDVVLDIRPSSRTYKRWLAVELHSQDYRQLYIPPGLAHGFQTLMDNTEVLYQMSEHYYPESAAGVRWNDPAFNIGWPDAERVISPRDRAFPDFGGGELTCRVL